MKNKTYQERFEGLKKERNDLLRWRKKSDNFIGDNTDRDILFVKLHDNTEYLKQLQDEIKTELYKDTFLPPSEQHQEYCLNIIKQIQELTK